MKLETIIVMVILSIAFGAKAEVRQVKPNYHLLPAVVREPATLEERVELKAKRAAVAERQKALMELAGIASGPTAATSAEISKQVERIKAKATTLSSLAAVVADSRKSIAEVDKLTDAEIEGLYFEQMKKKAIKDAVSEGVKEDLGKKEGKPNK